MKPFKAAVKSVVFIEDECHDNVLICPLSLHEMEDPVVLIPTGITYDRKSICTSLLVYPNLCPKTNTRYSEPLNYCDNVDLRVHLTNYVPYDDTEFRRVYREIQKRWGAEENASRSRTLHIITDPPGIDHTKSLSLTQSYRQFYIFTFGMNQGRIDYQAALQLTRNFPTDPVMLAMQANIEEAITGKRSIRSRKLYRKAVQNGIFHLAEAGCSYAQFFAGALYLFGDAGKKKKREKAVLWLHKSAAQGDPAAQCYLGYFFHIELPRNERDFPRALEWYLKAAHQGHALAQFLLSAYYEDREDIVLGSSAEKGHDWLEKAAIQGYDYAQHHMGLFCYHDKEDPSGARFWFELAAEQGNRNAQFELANLYRKGKVGERDNSGGSRRGRRNFQKAQAWYGKAATHGHGRAIGWWALVKARNVFSKKVK